MKTKITVFGEVLWDVLPDQKLAGGAPMNVAAHLNNYGIDTTFISRVGNDTLGSELLGYMQEHDLSTDLVQTGQTHLTGVAKANFSDTNEVTYKILHPVAWDYIQVEPKALTKISESELFVYGTLAARDETTRNTLLSYLPIAKTKVFDVNIRPPHYTPETTIELLKFANIVKLNEHEIKEVISWLTPYENDFQAMRFLQDHFSLHTVILTRGAEGAVVLTETGNFVIHGGFKVTVSDTIGSGDAFLAAYLYKTCSGSSPETALEFACAAGAYVATQPGALPQFSENDINAMIERANQDAPII